jgi:hypothetical protein
VRPKSIDLGEAILGAGVTDRPNVKCGTLSPTGLLRPGRALFTLLVVCAHFWRWFVVLVLAQNGGIPHMQPALAAIVTGLFVVVFRSGIGYFYY